MITNVAEYLIESAKKYPDKVVFSDENKSITFSELDAQARKIAKGINRAIGDKYNQPIAVYLSKGVDCLTAFMGIVYSGNYYSPIDTGMPLERSNIILSVLEPVLVITRCDYESNIPSEYSKIQFDDLCVGPVPEEEWSFPTLDVDPLYVLFTSGSTGIPKGVVINHRSVIDYTEWLAKTFHFDEKTIFGEQAPFYFDNSILDIYSTLKNGCELNVIPEKLFTFPNKLLEHMIERHVNTIFWVPSALVGVANSGVLDKVQLPNLEKILFCGEIMPVKPLNRWREKYPGALFANLYGPTEITDVCTYYIVDRDFDDAESLPIGKGCENTEILILNEDNQIASIDEPGELCVRGISLSLGYYKNWQKTNEVFVQNPLNNKYRDLIYRTGDVVKLNERGEIIYLCRKDSQIKHQGHRIELGEIDSATYAIEGVKKACAVYDGEQILLYCSVQNCLDEKLIYQQLKAKVPKYMLPKIIRILDDLPLNLNGKIDRVWINRHMKGEVDDAI